MARFGDTSQHFGGITFRSGYAFRSWKPERRCTPGLLLGSSL